MKRFFILLFIFGFLLFALHSVFPAFADEIEDLQRQIDELSQKLQMSRQATTPLEAQLSNLEKELNRIQEQVKLVEANIRQKEQELKKLELVIAETEKDLSRKQEIFARAVRAFYIRTKTDIPLATFFAASSATEATRELGFRQAAISENKRIILGIVSDLRGLNSKKEEARRRKAQLEQENARLAKVKEDTDKQAAFFKKEITGAKAYQTQLTSQIAELTTKQQAILAARSGTFTVSIGDSELADDYNASIKGFREAAPSGSFAVFSFGAHTHRKGMSQYGARGRAQSGQNYKAILKAYYGKEPVGKDTGGNISVSGYGSMDFETTYLFGIAEMPSTWNSEALKAQAVAARTYAYRSKQNGQTICTTEACQVFRKSKSDLLANDAGHPWRQAVEQTRGEVLEDVVTYYSSTTGGFITTMGWDTTDGGGGTNFMDKSYEKIGGSPWVYKAWYTQGYSPESNKCGRVNPWLNGEELADIVNAALVFKNGNSSETERITPVSTSCWGGNPYNYEELKNVAAKYGGISSVSAVSVSQGNGFTNEVTINGSITINGADFKRAFNLRAPGYLSVPQNGFAFFNIEKKQ